MTAMMELTVDKAPLPGSTPDAELNELRRLMAEQGLMLAAQGRMIEALDARREEIEELVADFLPMVNAAMLMATRNLEAATASGIGTWMAGALERIDDTVAAVITEGQVKQVQTGAALLAAGRKEIGGAAVMPDGLFLTCAQLITVWPGDAEGKLIGEDIYFGEDALATAVRITRADLPAYHRLAQ